MTSMNVSLPDSMRKWVETIVTKEGYGTSSEYIRDLVRADQRHRQKQALELRLLDALDTPRSELTAGNWEAVRKQVSRRLGKKTDE